MGYQFCGDDDDDDDRMFLYQRKLAQGQKLFGGGTDGLRVRSFAVAALTGSGSEAFRWWH